VANPQDEDYSWVPLFRKSVDSQVFANEGLWKVWTWCLMKASVKGQWVPIEVGRGTAEVWVGPGEFIFGRYAAAKELNMPPSTVRNRMRKLKLMGNIKIKGPEIQAQSHFPKTGRNQDRQKDRHCSVISLTSWAFYRDMMKKRTGKRTVEGQPKDTYKRDKNDKEYIHGQFETFWTAYPRKVKKKRSREIWEKLNPDTELFNQIMTSLEAYKQTEEWQKDRGRYVPHPTTWLNNSRWDDEIEIKKRWDHAAG
jgi:hypothetical protein